MQIGNFWTKPAFSPSNMGGSSYYFYSDRMQIRSDKIRQPHITDRIAIEPH
jgi:hypothetical protein